MGIGDSGISEYEANAAYTIAQSGVAVTAPANNTDENTLATVTIPALGPNFGLRITPLFTYTNNANVKTLRIRLGGTIIATSGPSTTASAQFIVMCRNRNDSSSQVTSVMAAGSTTSVAAVTTTTVSTGAGSTLTITAQKATGSDTVTLEAYTVEVVRFG